MKTVDLYQQFKDYMQQIADIRYASAVLQWDQETYMPPKGAEARGRQISTLAELAHERFTTDKMGNLLAELKEGEGLDPRQKRNVELSFEDYVKSKKLPSAFVRELSEAVNRSFHAWIDSRKANSFAVFEKALGKLIDLKKQEAIYLTYNDHPYDALLNDYDKGLTVKKTDAIFSGLKTSLLEIYNEILKQPQVDNAFLYKHFDKQAQWQLGIEILKKMQYDFDAGRQDLSEHPFTTNFSNKDVRVSTRIDENDFNNMLWSCIHEGGHALYEQGLPGDQYGLPLGEYCSLSIHESQSRLWENCIGRGEAFWKHNYTLVQQYFPEQFKNISLPQFYKAINKVQPSFIRTEADELTYHLHVMIRYEMEKLLIEGSLSVHDITAYWNEMYFKYLGIKVPNDNSGCLQDVHWSHGSFGYFATYSLGSLYAAQFHAAILRENPSLHTEIGEGNLQSVKYWLQQHIYSHGRYYTSEDLCVKATGETLNPDFFINYAKEKYHEIYAV